VPDYKVETGRYRSIQSFAANKIASGYYIIGWDCLINLGKALGGSEKVGMK
jgi:hypothetical protein